MCRIATFNSDVILNALILYLDSGYVFDSSGKEARIYLMNRFLFSVQKTDYASEIVWPSFRPYRFSFNQPDPAGGKFSLLWPLIYKNGNLHILPEGSAPLLQAVQSGYEGLAEFDYFRKRFPRRSTEWYDKYCPSSPTNFVAEARGSTSRLSNQEKEIITILKKCPSWPRKSQTQSASNLVTRRKITSAMCRVAEFKSRVISKAIRDWVKRNNFQAVDPPSKIFLLNRFLFDIATSARTGSSNWPGCPTYIELSGPVDKSYQVSLIWPLDYVGPTQLRVLDWDTARADGKPILCGIQEIAEFDYFREHYKRRTKAWYRRWSQ
jgi:hypothetical protein